MNKIHVNVSLETKKKIILIAEKKHRSINFIVNEALTSYVKKFKIADEELTHGRD